MKPLALALALTALTSIAPLAALADEQPQVVVAVAAPQTQLPAPETTSIPDYVTLDIAGY